MHLRCERILQQGDMLDFRSAEVYFESGIRLADHFQGILQCLGCHVKSKESGEKEVKVAKFKVNNASWDSPKFTLKYRINKISLAFESQKFKIKITPKLVRMAVHILLHNNFKLMRLPFAK